MKPRKVNDAQVDRLLSAMKRDPKYRAQLAARLVAKEGVKKLTPTGRIRVEWQRRYNSTMRRFQRYVTDSKQKRSFAKAPKQYQQQVRLEVRALPPPPIYKTKIEEREATRDFELTPPKFPEDPRDVPRERSLGDYQRQYLYKAIVAYHDGSSDDASDRMNLSRRGADLLALATTGEGVAIGGFDGSGEVKDAVSTLLRSLPYADVQDIRDFHDMLANMPDWEAGILLGDMEDGGTTFADWLDLWRECGLDYDDLMDSPEFWELWRAAYAKTKA